MELTRLPVNRIKQLNEDASHSMDCLRQDHAALCGELAVLKMAEGDDSPPTWQTLRDVCARLTLGLREHMLREERLLITRDHSLGAAESEAMSRPSIDHYSDYRYLQVITRHVTSESRPFLLNNRYRLLTDFLHGLHRHMDEQEAEFFGKQNNNQGNEE